MPPDFVIPERKKYNFLEKLIYNNMEKYPFLSYVKTA